MTIPLMRPVGCPEVLLLQLVDVVDGIEPRMERTKAGLGCLSPLKPVHTKEVHLR